MRAKMWVWAGVCGVLAAGLPAPAKAVIGATDVVPAATLLLPYFEVDLDNVEGVNTLFAVGNTSASAAVAHVTVWSDWSIPVLDFDIYLTGYDIQSVNLRDVFALGRLPITADDGIDGFPDTISPQGLFSQDINFPGGSDIGPCGVQVYGTPAITATFQAHLQALLTGKKSPVDGTCAGENYGDNVVRGYITIDSVTVCSLLFPASTGYFSGIADARNILTGDYFHVNPGQNFAQGNALVHIEAQSFYTPEADPFVPGDYTFYGRYVAGTAIDQREPLATTWWARYVNGAGFDGGTDLTVWRDSKLTPGATCAGPNYGELDTTQVLFFDEQENPFTTLTGGPSGEPIPDPDCLFCNETQRVAVSDFGAPFDFGWVYLNLNHASTADALLGPGYIAIAQSWVTVTMDASGRFSVGYEATPLSNASREVPGGHIID